MAKTKQQKEEIFDRLKEAAKDAGSVVFVGFHGLPVADTGAMREELREKGVSYFVAKKTLIRKAFGEAGFSGELPELPGEVAVAWGEDAVVPASSIHSFAKKHKDSITILGGVFEGRFQNQSEMSEIATIPPLEVLYGQFVGLLNSPLSKFVVALNEVAKTKEATA